MLKIISFDPPKTPTPGQRFRGRVSVQLSEYGLIINRIPVYADERGTNIKGVALPPSPDCETAKPIIEWVSPAQRAEFKDAVIAAIRAEYPGVLD